MQPRPRAETSSPLFPSFRFCISSLHLQCRKKRMRAVITILPIFCLILLIDELFEVASKSRQQLSFRRKRANEMNTNGGHSTAPPPTLSIQDLRAELARKIAWFIGSSERQITDVPGLLAGAQDCTDCAMLGNVHTERDRRCTGQQARRSRPNDFHLRPVAIPVDLDRLAHC